MRTLRGFAQETRVNATTVVSWLNARRPNPRFKFESMLPFHPPPAREKRTSAHALPHLLFSFFFVATGTWPFLFVPSERQMTRVVSTQRYSTGSGSVKCPMTDTKLIDIDHKKHRSWKPKIYSSYQKWILSRTYIRLMKSHTLRSLPLRAEKSFLYSKYVKLLKIMVAVLELSIYRQKLNIYSIFFFLKSAGL